MKRVFRYTLLIVFLLAIVACEKEKDSFYQPSYEFSTDNGGYVYKVNNEGYVISCNRMSEEIVAETFEYFYDKQSRILNSIVQYNPHNKTTSARSFINEYDSENNLTKSTTIFGLTDKNETITYYYYDDNNILIGSKLENINGLGYYSCGKTFSYKDGILISEIDTIWSDDEIKVGKSIYEYNGDGTLKYVARYLNNIDKAVDSTCFYYNLMNQVESIYAYLYDSKNDIYFPRYSDSMNYDEYGRYLIYYSLDGGYIRQGVSFNYSSEFTLRPMIYPTTDFEAYYLNLPLNGFAIRTFAPYWKY